MSKNKSKRDAEIVIPVGSLDEAGDGGDLTINVGIKHLVYIDATGVDIEINAWEARRLGEILIKAAQRMDESR